MCLYPKFIINRKYTPTIKNKGNIPPLSDERVKYVPVGCGVCMECKKQKARSWQVRLHEELRTNKNAIFITLSFTDKSLNNLEIDLNSNLKGYDLDNKIATLAIRRFLERHRQKYKMPLRHWLVTELGQTNTERLHLHGIFFTSLNKNELQSLWKYGNIWIGEYVNEKTINYIIKYIHKSDIIHKYYNPIILTSKGIGSNYLNRIDSKRNSFNDKKTDELYITRNGIKLPLPIYYRNKLYNDYEREKLWLNRLDTNTRYVNKMKIDVSKSEQSYFNVLKHARKLNKLLGYGNDTTDWHRKKYERELRNIKKLERIKKDISKGEYEIIFANT